MKAATVFLIALGLCVAGIGGFFTMLMWKSYQRAAEMHAWPQVEAVILESAVEEWQHDEFSPMEYRVRILYGYEWEGEAKTGDQLTFRGNPNSNKRANPQGWVEDYPAGSKTMAFINPENPDAAILKPDSKAAGYSIWFPMLFVVGGLGISAKAIFSGFSRKPSNSGIGVAG